MTQPAYSTPAPAALTLLPKSGPTAMEAIGAIVAAEGEMDLAAERLFGPPIKGELHPKALLIATIASDPTALLELQRQLRTLTLLQAFQSTRLAAVTVEGTLEKLPSSDRAKFYTSLLSILSTLTDEHSASYTANFNSSSTSTSLNIQEAVFKQLPPDVREALKVLNMPTQLPFQPDSDDGEQLELPSTNGWSGGNPPPNAANGTS